MGCDIHLWAEAKRSYPNTEVKPQWEAFGSVFKNHYHNPDEIVTKDETGYSFNKKMTDSPWQGRNYDLFAILADVRNDRGFAGVDTGDGFVPIAMPRGIPEDASAYFKKQAKRWGEDGHSHSYITLEELKAFDWNQTTKHRGFVDPLEYKVFKKKGKPSSWCGGTSAKTITNEEMDEYLKNTKIKKGAWPLPYTQVEWEETYADSVGDFFTKTIPALEELLTLKYAQAIRIVFFFDN